ncbi:MAG: phosphate regulon sensor histidine kinase PhoR [Gammaproteobacteria bacterium]|nr:phosphate regulon sensor histidine kinase PhoR [Gammaproteobacteria bacterium]NNJ50274.1 phosphate regulon sensor histidine kinase PhoR [Gammaproteobacteria bacterium]
MAKISITPSLRRELVLLITWIAFMLLIGMITESVFLLLFIALAVYLAWHLFNLNRLHKWLVNPSKKTPEVFGIWDDVYYQLYQLFKRQRKARRRLTSILNRFQKSTRALPYATIVLNKSNEIEWFNPAARLMFNFNSGMDVGQRIDNLIRQPKFVNYLLKKDFQKPLKFQVNQRQLILNMTPYGDGQYLISARDITSLSQLDDMRRDFISNASHELRTPLTVMTGYIEFLQHNADEQLKVPLDMIQQQTVRMNKIITELIDLAKLESAAAVDFSNVIDIHTLLNDVYNEAIALDQEQHHIELVIENEVPGKELASHLNGSYEELRMAFSNLLTNAIRYTPDAETITLFATSHDTGTTIGVKDEGVGIGYEHIPRLTERFYRVDEGRSREQGGTGLGLAIVKHVLDRHNASLHILSEPGKGSTFCCEFPLNYEEY